MKSRYLIGLLLFVTATPLAASDRATSELAVVKLEPHRVAGQVSRGEPVALAVDGQAIELRLERFSVVTPESRFEVGRRRATAARLSFDPESIAFYRGRVVGRPGSHVFLAFGAGSTTGQIDLGPGDGRYRLSRLDGSGRRLPEGRVSLFPARSGGRPPEVPECGVDALPSKQHGATPAVPKSGSTTRLRHLQLALETDYEYFQLFGDLEAAAAYLVTLYGEMSAIYMRDVDVRIELTYVRLWDDPDDLFNDVDPTPLFDFRDHWEANMQDVPRDAAQLVSGRRDYPFGGQAFIRTTCSSNAYSVWGYATGQLPEPSQPSPRHYDLSIGAHELGHTTGTAHTHDSPADVDTCNDPLTVPQRGSIMSYCAQTWSGQNANRDMYFHSRTQTQIEFHLEGVDCVPIDCDQNGLADEDEILEDPTLDKNGSGVLDVCEDCNANDVLDDEDIASERSTDRDDDGVPDECQPDCNDNGLPDSMDVMMGISVDAYGDGVPDECEVDCDGDGTSDYTQIQLDVTVDLNRNRVLDACEDCDDDGTLDAATLDRSHNLWIASGLPAAPIYEFHGDSGVQVGASESVPGAMINEGQDVIVVGPSRILVASGGDDRVKEFTGAGAYVGNLVEAGAGGLQYPTGLLMLADGRLLVASRDGDAVLAYDGIEGTALGAFVEAGSGGLVQPHGMALGPSGNLFVASGDGRVLRYDGVTGTFLDEFVGLARNAGLSQPRGMAFKPDGNLLVASFGSNEVLEYAGDDGAPLGKWAKVGTDERLTQISPWGVRVAPSGNVFVARTGEAFGSVAGFDDHDHRQLRSTVTLLHLTNAQIYEFDSTTGNFLRTHVGGNDHDLLFPTGFDFVPGYDLDCNLNFVPDDCDIARGTSLDLDLGGVPDECEVDCNTNGVQDRLDVIPYGVETDCDNNLRPDVCDLADGADDCNANGIPDTCETAAELGPQPMVIDDLGLKQVDGFTTLDWFFQGGVFVYDVAGSTLSSLRAGGSVVAATCLVDDHLASAWSDPRADPPSGEGFYYLVRSQTACLESNWGETGAGAKRLLPAACP